MNGIQANRSPAPELNLPLADSGDLFALQSLRGQAVLVIFLSHAA